MLKIQVYGKPWSKVDPTSDALNLNLAYVSGQSICLRQSG